MFELLHVTVEGISEMPCGHYSDVYCQQDAHNQEQLGILHNLQQ